MYNENVYTEGIVYERVWEAYDELPENIKGLLEKEKYEIYVVDQLKSNEIGYVTLGKTYFIPRIIKISNLDLCVKRTTFHEIGHVIDDEATLKFISGSDEFIDIYLDEKENFRVSNNYDYFTSTEIEYFAQAFSEYMMDPYRLKTYTPRTYDFIEQCLK
mgnify:CR=1 FL=1